MATKSSASTTGRKATSSKAASPKATKVAAAKTSAPRASSTPAKKRTTKRNQPQPASAGALFGQQLAEPGDTKYIELNNITKAAFISALSVTGVVQEACRNLKLNDKVAYLERQKDPEFRAAWDKAVKDAFVVFENEARRRAFLGYDRPVYQQGMLVGHTREHSDVLAQMMLRAGKPDEYNPKTQTTIEHAGAVGLKINQLSDEDLNKELNAALRHVTGGHLAVNSAGVIVQTRGARDAVEDALSPPDLAGADDDPTS